MGMRIPAVVPISELFGKTPSKVYGVLMDEEGTPVSNMVKKRWEQLHYVLASKRNEVTFAFFESPEKWPKDFKKRWRERVGGDEEALETTLNDWAQPKEPYVYTYAEMLNLNTTTDLPSLLLFTELNAEKAEKLRIPDYGEDELFTLFKSIIDTADYCIKQQYTDDEARLHCIKRMLTSRRATLFRSTGHYKRSTWKYFKEHPVETIEFAKGLLGTCVKGLPL